MSNFLTPKSEYTKNVSNNILHRPTFFLVLSFALSLIGIGCTSEKSKSLPTIEELIAPPIVGLTIVDETFDIELGANKSWRFESLNGGNIEGEYNTTGVGTEILIFDEAEF